MNLYINSKEVKEGDILFDVLHGEVKVYKIRNINTDKFCKLNEQLICIGTNTNKYGDVRVKYFNYTLDGKQHSFDVLPKIYKSNPFLN